MNPKSDDQAVVRQWLGEAPGRAAHDPALHALDALFGPDPTPTQMRAAQARLRRALDAARAPAGVVYYTALKTPVGRLWAAATEGGLVKVSFFQDEAAFVGELRRALKREVSRSAAEMRTFVGQLGEYLTGRREAFDLPVDLSLTTPFQRRVLLAARQIPRGRTTTYADLARRIGRPRAARAVGQALSRNPVPIVIPCHRVVASDGSLRGYAGKRGIKTKAQLLTLEGARPA